MSVSGSLGHGPGLCPSTNDIDSTTVKHAPVTYSRKRHDGAENSTGSQWCSTSTEASSSIYISGNAKVQATKKLSLLPSEAECADDEKDDEDEQCNASPKFAFSWKKRLQELDNEDEFTLMTFSGSNDNDTSLTKHESPFKAPTKCVEINQTGLKGRQVPLISKQKITSSIHDYLTASARRSSPLSPVKSRASEPSTPDRGHTPHRITHRSVVHDSDSELEPSRDKLGSSFGTSPPVIFHTPATRSSTPPTSDDEMPQKLTSKGKGKERTVTRRSTPLQFEEPASGARGRSVLSNQRRTMQRTKAPTKMELEETAKDRARLVADQNVSIPKAEQGRRFTMRTFFAGIGGNQELGMKQPSDPILPFSSSPSRQEAELQSREEPLSRGKTPELQMVPDKMRLQDFKQQVLILQSSKARVDDDDDDDLEIDNAPVTISLLSAAYKKQKSRFRSADTLSRYSSAHLRSKDTTQKTANKDKKAPSQAELSRFLAERVKEQNAQAIKQKEDEWLRRGGRLKTYPTEENPDLLRTYVRKGLENSLREFEVHTEDDRAEQSAEEFGHGPEPTSDNTKSTSSRKVDCNGGSRPEDQLTDDEVEELMLRRRNHRAAGVINSDSESEGCALVFVRKHGLGRTVAADESAENLTPLASSSLCVVHRSSVSSLDDVAEDRSDKENNQKLVFDRSEDKENKAVARPEASPLLRHFSVDNASNNNKYGTLVSPDSHPKEGTSEESDQRSPLTVLSEDKHKALQPEPSWTDMISSRHGVLEAHVASSGSTSPQKEKHAFDIVQLEEAPLLQPAFADLFDSGTENTNSSQPKWKAKPVTCSPHQQANVLGLTQDILLQPAFNIGDQVLRKAESIFGKEQLFLLEANKKVQKNQFYVNNFGFLTQTCPSDEDVELYKSPPVSQQSAYGALPSSSVKDSRRQPLSTISLSSVLDDKDDAADAPRRRLMKRRTPSPSPTVLTGDLDSPTPAPRNAFDILNLGHGSLAHGGKKSMLQRSELVEAEAEESDDDDIFGIGSKKRDEDEEDEEDLDRTLETLVDDRDMNADTLAAERVFEKFQEHVGYDDQELEKLHQAAVHGELRRKRRNQGIGLDDSDEESDEDKRNGRIRRRMSKRQRIDRDNIKALADNEETKSFYKVYEYDLFDDGNLELGYLQQQDVVMNDWSNEADSECVTREEIAQHVRELARRKETEPTLDPHDVSWIDGDKSDEEAGVKVKIVSASEKKDSVSIVNNETFEINNHSIQVEGEAEKSRMHSWAKMECKRLAGAARSGGGVAVTGHGKCKAKAGGRMQGVSSDDSIVQRKGRQRKPLKATSSMLASVSDRSARFG